MKRYNLAYIQGVPQALEHSNGEWVRYEDVAPIINELGSYNPPTHDDGKYKTKPVTEMQIWGELNKLINFPKHCTRAMIILEKGSLVKVECTVIGQKGTGEPISKWFNLVEVEERTK